MTTPASNWTRGDFIFRNVDFRRPWNITVVSPPLMLSSMVPAALQTGKELAGVQSRHVQRKDREVPKNGVIVE